MYIGSRYMGKVEEIQAELQHLAWKLDELDKEIERDDLFTGDWTNNTFALALDDLRDDMKEVAHYIDLASEYTTDIIKNEGGKKE